MSWSQFGAADGELDREAALGGEALLGQVLDDGPDAGDGVQLAAQDGRELGLAQLPLLGRDQGDVQVARSSSRPCRMKVKDWMTSGRPMTMSSACWTGACPSR